MKLDSKYALQLEGICLKALGMTSEHNVLGGIVSKDSFEFHPYDALIVVFCVKRDEMTEEQRMEILQNESVVNVRHSDRIKGYISSADSESFVKILRDLVE